MPPALLEDQVVQGAGERGLAAAGQAGEEQHQALLAGARPVLLDDRGDLVGQVALAGHGEHVAGRRSRATTRRPQLVVGVGVAVRRERDGDHEASGSSAAAARVARTRPGAESPRACRCR